MTLIDELNQPNHTADHEQRIRASIDALLIQAANLASSVGFNIDAPIRQLRDDLSALPADAALLEQATLRYLAEFRQRLPLQLREAV